MGRMLMPLDLKSMKILIPTKLVLLAAALGLAATPPSQAAQFTILKSFAASALEGSDSTGNCAVVGNQIFGVTENGGAGGMGVLYKMNLDGTGFTKLRDFAASEGRPLDSYSYSDTSIIASGNAIYGSLYDGSSNWEGILYKIDADGKNWEILKNFDYSTDGYAPSPCFLDGNVIYGTCYESGGNPVNDEGAIFRVNSDGKDFTTLYTFQGGSDGANPIKIIDGGTSIYGVTRYGGIANKGTIFKINKDGTGYQQLKYFSGSDVDWLKSLVLSGNTLVGSAAGGVATVANSGPSGCLFRIQTDGSNFQVVKTFFWPTIYHPNTLCASGNTIYGTCQNGGGSDKYGGLFQINFDGSGFQTLYTSPEYNYSSSNWHGFGVSLLLSGGRLYGTNGGGGAGGLGFIFSFDLGSSANPPALTGAVYSAVTFTGSLHALQALPTTAKTLRSITTTTDTTKLVATPLTNLAILKRVQAAGLIEATTGYSIVCLDNDGALEFYAYKKGFSLVPLATQIAFTETANLQAATLASAYNNLTGNTTTSESGTEKSQANGNFLGMSVNLCRTIAFRSSTYKLNSVTYSYYPSTTSGYFFGADSSNSEFVEGKITIAAPAPIQVP